MLLSELFPRQSSKHALSGVFWLFEGAHERLEGLVQALDRGIGYGKIMLKAYEVVRGARQRSIERGHCAGAIIS